jgi:aldose 1-epimerase
MYSGVTFDGNSTYASCRSPGTGLEVRIQADHNFHDWVLFTPPNRPSLAIEPYTCPPNAINMAQEGIEDSHLLTLNPGQSWHCQVVLEVL